MSGEEDEGQDKSFDPTPRRLEQAREKGDVAASADLHLAGAYLGLLAALFVGGGAAAGAFGAALTPFFGMADQLEGRILGPGGLELSARMVGVAALTTAPLFLLPALGTLASLIAQQAVVVAPSKLEPKLDRINPVKTAGHKFGLTGMVEFVKSATKMGLISVGVWLWLVAETPRLVGLAALPARRLGAELGGALVSLLIVIAAIALVIGALDYLWQRYDHARKLMMSLQELRDESKETDGDPHARQERRRRAEAIATNRMLLDVPKADVVIVNPTHYAVALKWSRTRGAAPVCVAKGVDDVAASIRARAAEAGVPIHRDPPTARMLHAAVEIGREVRPEHYRAVAAAIRFADQMRRKARGGKP